MFIELKLISVLDEDLVDYVEPLEKNRRALLLSIVEPFKGSAFVELVAEPDPLVANQRLKTLEGSEKWIKQ